MQYICQKKIIKKFVSKIFSIILLMTKVVFFCCFTAKATQKVEKPEVIFQKTIKIQKREIFCFSEDSEVLELL